MAHPPQLIPTLLPVAWPTGEPASLLGIQKPESQSNLWMVLLTY